MPSRVWRVLSPLVVVGLTTACPKVPNQTASMQRAGVEVSARDVRTRTLDLGHYAAAVIEGAADSISAVTDDPAVRENALRWKTYVIPQVREAVLRPDPFVGAIDLSALFAQLDRYFSGGDGSMLFGDRQAVAVGAIRSLRGATQALALSLAGGQDSVAQRWSDRVDEWAAAHPIADSRYTRPTPIRDLQTLARDVAGIGGVAASMENEMRLLQERLAFMQDYGASDLAWRTALGLREAAGPETLDSLRALVMHSFALVGGFPDLVASERGAVLEDLTAERVAVMRELLLHRRAVLAALTGEREAVLANVDSQIGVILRTASSERAAALVGADSIVQHGLAQARSLVNHTLLLLILAEGAAIVLVGAVAFVVVRYARPPA
jgi:hypothetical protein